MKRNLVSLQFPAVLVGAAIIAGTLSAQTTGTILGTIRDPQGAVIPQTDRIDRSGSGCRQGD
jgi:hypothetical protein